MTELPKPKTKWDRLAEGLFSIAIALILIIYGNWSAFILIISAVFSILGVGSLATVPEIRYYFKVVINGLTRKQVFKNVGTISGSNVVGPVDTGGGPLIIKQTVGPQKIPFLRAVVRLVPGMSLGELWLQIDLKNIGDGIATDIDGELVLEGGNPMKVLDTSPLKDTPPIGPNETGNGRVKGVSREILQAIKQYSLSIRYKDMNGNSMTPIQVKGTGEELNRRLTDESLQRAGLYGLD